jgi:hypothetical protein
LDAWLEQHHAQMPRRGPWRPWQTQFGVGRKAVFRACPFNSDHARNLGAFIGQLPGGAVVVRCLHARCEHQSWRTLRGRIEGVEDAGTEIDSAVEL